MKALLLTLMFLISMTAFSQQKYGREDGTTALKDSFIVVNKDSIMSLQPNVIDHNALAKSYKNKSKRNGIAAAILGVVGIGSFWYGVSIYEINIDLSGFTWHKFDANTKVNTRTSGSGGSSDNTISGALMVVGTACFVSAIICTVKAVKYHNKAGKELKLSIKGTTASLTYTF